ncbi:MAG TPA: NAD(P)/FAD-dependent oxidoreductase [Candidatus Acidoferrales bacterium]|nr:NAD(P)/FAD-dependent oxidoreductase [Candidatus Acidoferrales bacterium]
MREEYDVIVVGAGPGGSIAARTAAADCDVLLIEKRQEIGAPVRCAEFVPKDQFLKASKYIQLNKKWIASEINGIRMNAPDGTTFEASGETLGIGGGFGYVLERKIFDRQLAKDAARAGVDIMVRTRATGLIIEDSHVKGVKLNRLGEDFEVRSKVVIGADGVESQVGRWGGINTTLKLKDIGSCAQYYLENVDIAKNVFDFYIGSEIPGGYAWIFPKGARAANVGLGVLGSKLAAKRPIEYLNEFVAKKCPGGQPVELVMGGAPLSDALKTLVRNGLMLIGDAARHTEPITGSGIPSAIRDGMMAGEVAQKAVHANDSSVRVLREYETRWRNSFGRIHWGMYKIKEFMVKLSDDELNRITRVFQGTMREELSIRGITMRLLKKDPRLLLTIRHLLF